MAFVQCTSTRSHSRKTNVCNTKTSRKLQRFRQRPKRMYCFNIGHVGRPSYSSSRNADASARFGSSRLAGVALFGLPRGVLPSPASAPLAPAPKDSEFELRRRWYASVAITSCGLPCSLMQPFSKISTLLKCLSRSESGCSTTKRVRPSSKGPRISLSSKALAVGASTAPKGSSSSTKRADARYAARAMFTRAFCPPDKEMPRAPIKELSPPSNVSKSASSDAHRMACW
mmetsp:Transcript_52059/g.158041  ORF Transcript_52059/g.158041 Transcript_52059/m.158041 type:complete len:229 (+) Transcript_52059:904-1590(+)